MVKRNPFDVFLMVFQFTWGGRWQDGAANTTGEEAEQVNCYISRLGSTTKRMTAAGIFSTVAVRFHRILINQTTVGLVVHCSPGNWYTIIYNTVIVTLVLTSNFFSLYFNYY